MRAIVSGASRGIGKAVALALAAEGIDLALTSTKMADIEAVSEEIRSAYPEREILLHACDLTINDRVEDFAGEVAKTWDHIDILVNNAGLFLPGKITEEPLSVLEKMISTNFFSAYYVTRAFLPLLLKSGQGYIFNMSSVAALGAYESGGGYGIAKAAMLSLSRTLRAELMEQNIKVTALLPGATWTDSWSSSGLPEERFMAADDIAKVVTGILKLGPGAVVEEVILRPQQGDI